MNGLIKVRRCNKGYHAGTLMLMLGLLGFIAVVCSSCASVEFGVFARRHDTSKETRTATETNWRCAFMDCSKEGK
jgi:hypothetical protein